MNAETEQRPTKVYKCVVEEKAEGPDGSILSLTIASFESQYPTRITRVEPVLAQQLKIGASYNLLLERQNLKKGKSGERAYDYYWGLKALGGEGEVPQPAQDAPQGDAVAPRGMPAGVGEVDPTRRSIERQTALKQSTLVAAANIGAGLAITPAEITETAEWFYGWLSGSNGATRPVDDILEEEFPSEERSEEQDSPSE